MNITEYKEMDGIALASLIEKREISSAEAAETAMELLETMDEKLNAVARTRFEAAKKELKTDGGKHHAPFSGVPIVLKDLSQTIAGEAALAGTKLLEGTKAETTANLVSDLQQAGCVPIAYSTTPEFGLKNISEAKVYGPTRNPWDTDYSSGGSSGGSASLVASGVVPIAGASDGGGSIRIPASFTGLFGLKPTRGRTAVGPGVGRQWQGAAIDFVLTRSVRDSARMLDNLQRFQQEAAFHIPLYGGHYEKLKETMPERTLKIGYSLESPVGTPVSEEAKRTTKKLLHWLEKQGHIVEEAQNGIDGTQLMRDYYIMNSGEIGAVLAQFEAGLQRDIRSDDLEMEAWMMYTAGKSVTAAAYSASLASWDQAAAKMAVYHQQYDFYITPATAFHAPKVGELTPSAEKEADYKERIMQLDADGQQELIYDMFLPSLTYTPFTQLANLTGQPAMSLPLHVCENGLPIGVQVMAAKGQEHRLLQLAYVLEETELWQGMKGNPFMKG